MSSVGLKNIGHQIYWIRYGGSPTRRQQILLKIVLSRESISDGGARYLFSSDTCTAFHQCSWNSELILVYAGLSGLMFSWKVLLHYPITTQRLLATNDPKG